jgi:hypothetical protein
MASPASPNPPAELEIPLGGHKYNSDLLVYCEDREAARREHPEVAHVLIHPELIAAFDRIDDEANGAKNASRTWGFRAVVMALLSLLGGSSAVLWEQAGDGWRIGIAGVSAVLGVAAALVAWVGILYGPRKAAWLRNRLRTERLRQFHFQSFVAHFKDVVDSVAAVRKDEQAKLVYETKRASWFQAFCNEYGISGNVNADKPAVAEADKKADTKCKEIIESHRESAPPIWVHDHQEPQFPKPENDTKDPEHLSKAYELVFEAYAKFRFEHQISYANHTLRENDEPPKHWTWFLAIKQPLRVWHLRLKRLWFGAGLALVLLHVVVILSVFFNCSRDADVRKVFESCLHVGIVWVALFAVAARTLADGFALNREIERYEEYRAVCSELYGKFTATTSPEEKFNAMVRMERASFEEMREFLRSNHEASYVM